MSIRAKLLAGVLVTVLGACSTAALCTWTLNELGIGSPLDREIERAHQRLARLALLDGLFGKVRATLATLVYEARASFDRSAYDELLRLDRDIDTVFAVILAHEDTLTQNRSNLDLQRARETYGDFATARDSLIVPWLREGRVDDAARLAFGEQALRYERFTRLAAKEAERAATAIVRVRARAEEQYDAYAWKTVALILCVAATSGALCWQTARSILGPLGHLMDFAGAISLGRLDARASVAGQREIGELARVVNGMLDRIAEGAQRFQLAFDAAPTGMLMIDAHGRVVLVNDKVEQEFGFAPEELIDRPVEALVPDASRAAHSALVEGYFRAPAERRVGDRTTLRGRHRDGRLFPVEVALKPLRTSDGLFAIAAITDITIRQRQEEELARSNQELERFAFVAAHDLREPARSVLTLTTLLRSTQEARVDDRGRQILRFLSSSSQRMLDLVDSLLEHSRIGRMSQIEEVDCDQVVRDVLHDLASAIEDSGARVSASRLPTISGRSLEMRLLFQNLIANAIKFRAKDTTPVVEIGCTESDSAITFWVRDNGIGIRADQRDKVFDMFQRGTSSHSGCGIGLTHCKKIVELHGGRIAISDSALGGTEVRFALPATRPTAAAQKTNMDGPPSRLEGEDA